MRLNSVAVGEPSWPGCDRSVLVKTDENSRSVGCVEIFRSSELLEGGPRRFSVGDSTTNNKQDLIGTTCQESCLRSFLQRGSIYDDQVVGVAHLTKQRRNPGTCENPEPVAVRQARWQIVNAKILDGFNHIGKWTVVRQRAEQTGAPVTASSSRLADVKDQRAQP